MNDFQGGEIVIYQGKDGLTKIDVRMKEETVWLSLDQMSELFCRNKSTVSRHIKNIFEEGELVKDAVVAKFATTAAHGHTAAEVIFERADSEKPFMGLTSFSGSFPTSKDIKIAKNYLEADELKVLNNLVSGYFDFAEIQAMRKRPMYMNDYITQLDNILGSTGEKLLTDAGKVSHNQAMKKAEAEYRKYQEKTLTDVEKAYIETIKSISDKASER